MHRMPFCGFCAAIALCLGLAGGGPAEAAMRCGVFVGLGYRCYDTRSGTGGKVFQQMRRNTRRCGYFNPGCVHRPTPRHHVRRGPAYVLPQTGKAYRARPGPGYVAPTTSPYTPPTVGPGYVAPRLGPGFTPPQ